MVIRFIFLVFGAYVLGSIPVSYLIGRHRKVDLARSGTGQVGAGNLARMAHSKKLGVTAGLIDAAKGVFAVWLGYSLGLDLSLQIWVGLAVIAGHNWSIFLNFKGGRGVAIVIGLIWALLFNPEYSIWIPILYVVIGLSLVALIHSTPLPVLVMTALLPVFSAVFMHDYGVTGAFIALLAVVVLKRLLPSRRALTVNRHVMINRLLYDRDIKDSKVWMYRESTEEKKEINP